MGQKSRVPFLDVKLQQQAIRGEIDAAIDRTFETADFILGGQLHEFEQSFARFCDTQHAIGVSSGTAALHLALLALDVKPGDEVITVPNTFIATVEAILYTGAVPVFVDVDPNTYCLDTKLLERAIRPRTRAIVPVHMYGQPCDMESVMAIANHHEIAVVEDACQAHGATFMGRKVGSFGAAAAFSFYPTKNLGGIGDGGAVTTNDPEIAKRIRGLRHHAQYEANVFPEVGYNCRLDTIQAGILNVKLGHLDRWNERRREIAARYRTGLQGTEYRFQSIVPGTEPVFHILAVRHPRKRVVCDQLDAAGVGYGSHIMAPIHRQPGYQHLVRDGESFSVSEELSQTLISLPVFPELTDEQVDYIVNALGKVEVSV
jgi:dTDP-4-amino-4,6-dideoxygalactose transaminase